MKRDTSHVVVTGGSLGSKEACGKCLRCGDTLRWVLPMDVEVWCAMVKAFVKQHAGCKPRAAA